MARIGLNRGEIVGKDRGVDSTPKKTYLWEMDINTLIAFLIAIPLATWFLKVNARRKGEEFSWKKLNDETKTFRCPHCKKRIPVGATVCGFCTRDI
jgi:hypothetical protein